MTYFPSQQLIYQLVSGHYEDISSKRLGDNIIYYSNQNTFETKRRC